MSFEGKSSIEGNSSGSGEGENLWGSILDSVSKGKRNFNNKRIVVLGKYLAREILVGRIED
jgi:hypothetical protein